MKAEIKNIEKYFGKKQVLCGASLTAEGGEYITIAGGNGCGKSTLLGVLAGTLSGSGSFLVDGEELMGNDKKRNKVIGYIPQTPPLFEELTAKDHLELFWGKKGMNGKVGKGIVSMLGVDEFLRVPVRKMSGGMKKRLSVACAVAHGPSILFLDEVGAALDPDCRESIYGYIRAFCEAGGIVISVTHDLGEITRSDRCYALKDGVLGEVKSSERTALFEELYS